MDKNQTQKGESMVENQTEFELNMVEFWSCPSSNQIIGSVELKAALFSLSDKELLILFKEIQEYIVEMNNEKEIN